MITSFLEPISKGFFCDDETIKYPYKQSTVGISFLCLFYLVLPNVSVNISIVISDIYLFKLQLSKTQSVFLIIRIRYFRNLSKQLKMIYFLINDFIFAKTLYFKNSEFLLEDNIYSLYFFYLLHNYYNFNYFK